HALLRALVGHALRGAPNRDRFAALRAGRSCPARALGVQPHMASKFAQFLKDNKIDPRRLLVASRGVERLKPEDRKLKLEKRQAKAKASGQPPAASEGEEKKAPPKPRSGRPVTSRVLEAATGGKAILGPAKSRLLRAVNQVLTQRKKAAVDLRAIF